MSIDRDFGRNNYECQKNTYVNVKPSGNPNEQSKQKGRYYFYDYEFY